jgi:phosphoribosyl 1,2-cyclic phosphate phosphodiesterase
MTPTVTILGCGSSGGVPRPGSGWGACDPANPRNRRRRCSILVETSDDSGATRLLVDTSPDLREQLIDARVTDLDAVLFSHDHADHTHGIDDMRTLVLHMRRKVPVFADERTAQTLKARFGYIFETPPGSAYPPILDMRPLRAGRPLTIEGGGPAIAALPFAVEHGFGYEALGFRFGGVVYLPDVSALSAAAIDIFAGADTLIIDCLRETPHPSHFNLEQSLAAVAALRPRRAILTNLHVDLDYESLRSRLPAGIEPAFDGMIIEPKA